MSQFNFYHFNKTFRNRVLVTLMVLLVLVGAYYIRHHYYLQNLDGHEYFSSGSYQEPIFPKLNQKQGLNLGWAHVDRKTLTGPFSMHHPPKSSYTNFSESKIPNTIRIGIFGDSFVWGEEAAYAFDFPTLLQDLFDQVGHDHVQVLNFGVMGYGMHQAFLMWEYLGKKYDLDYSIFLPFHYYIDRDVTFNLHHTSFCPIHARYIVTTQLELTFLPVIGNSRKEACSLYHRLRTPWQYILYDRYSPAFLRVLVPKGRQFKSNPFYYRNMDKTEEALTTYKLLFSRLAAEANHPIVVCDHADICGLQKGISGDIYFYESQITQKYQKLLPELYSAPKNHLSALGNEMRAQELFSLLMAQKAGELKVMTLASMPDLTNVRFESSPPLNQYDQVRVSIQGHIAADFVSHEDGALAWRFEKDLDFKRDAIASLLWVSARGGLQFIPVSFPLENGETVFVRLELDNDTLRIPIGQIEAASSIIGRLRLTCGQWVTASGHPTWRLKCKENSLRSLRLEGSGGLQTVQIDVGENARPLMKRERIEGLQRLKNTLKNVFNVKLRLTIPLEPVISSMAILRAKSGSLTLKESHINDVGTLDLVVQKKNEHSRTFPIVPYHLIAASPPQSHPVYSYPIQ